MLCERYEDKCASAANVCADKSSCVNQLNGDLYCACKDAEQISDTSGMDDMILNITHFY